MLYVHRSFLPQQPDIGRLRRALQLAIELEHTTIPLYLYALYSLQQDRNARIAELIESVVKEEMLHMLLACNLLNAIGGTPRLDAPSFIPRFPTRAPGALAGRFRVGLEPFSKSLVRRVFMRIESPDNPLRFGGGPYVKPPDHDTIGDLYRDILAQLHEGKNDMFVGCPARQVSNARLPDLIMVSDFATAQKAIEIIVEQGEGSDGSPKNDEGEYAHYYRFAEIYVGKEIIINRHAPHHVPPEQRYLYGGKCVPFDPNGVWPIPANPRAADHAPGTQARRACDNFNYTYTFMLRTLHAAVNGRQEAMQGAIGQMFSLKHQAQEMAAGLSTGGLHVGPSFEFQPINPI